MDDISFQPPEHSNLYVLWVSVVIIAVVIGGYIYLNTQTIQTEHEVTTTHTTWFNQTTTEKVYENLTIEEFSLNRIKYDGEEVSILGYLTHEIKRPVTTPIHYYFITDNTNNKIEVINITPEQMKLFPKEKISKYPYIIKGVYVKGYMSAQLSAKSIQAQEDHSYKIVEKIIKVPQEVTVKEKRIANITLWEKIFD